MRSCVIKLMVESQQRVVYNARREAGPDIPPRSSTAAIRLHACMQQALRDSRSRSQRSHGWGASSVGRALRSQRRGRGFNSPALHQTKLARAARSSSFYRHDCARINTAHRLSHEFLNLYFSSDTVTVPLAYSSGSYCFPQTSTTSLPPLNRSLYNADPICRSPL